MSNAYIPDQLHHMSKKELLEFAQTVHEENVKLARIKNEWERVFLPIEKYCKESNLTALGKSYTKSLVDSHSSLREQLAKANERLKELETQHQLLTKQIEPLLDMQEDGEYYTRCHLAEDIYEAFIEGSSVDALNKFAIEKNIEALDKVESVYMQAAETSEPVSFREAFDAVEEQLRKEQE